MAIVFRIPPKLTHYSFSTDRILSSTFLAIVELRLHDVTSCRDSFVIDTPIIFWIKSQTWFASTSRKSPWETQIFASQMLLALHKQAGELECFQPRSSLSRSLCQHWPHLNNSILLECPNWRGNSDSASSFQPTRLWYSSLSNWHSSLSSTNLLTNRISKQHQQLLMKPKANTKADAYYKHW